VWTSGSNALRAYDPATGAWSQVALPPWERGQIIERFALDGAGNPLVVFTRFGGAGPWHSTAVYFLQDGAWVEVYDPGVDLPVSLLASGSDGAIWAYAMGPLFRVTDGEHREIGNVPCARCAAMAVDGTGRVWIGGEANFGPALWWYK
jgi:hypothetical protein